MNTNATSVQLSLCLIPLATVGCVPSKQFDPLMPKPGVRFYAVRAGREGPKVYDTWDEVRCVYYLLNWSDCSHFIEALRNVCCS